MSLDPGINYITMLLFQLLQTLWVTFQVTTSIRGAPASSALTLYQSLVIIHEPQIVTFAVVERGMEHKGEQR